MAMFYGLAVLCTGRTRDVIRKHRGVGLAGCKARQLCNSENMTMLAQLVLLALAFSGKVLSMTY